MIISGNGDGDGGLESTVNLEQLQLVQLCFGEHEFGVAVDHESEHDDVASECSSVDEEDLGHSPGPKNDVGITFDFDPLHFVQEKLAYGVSLASLCRDLETYATHLDNNILRHVNTDVHDAFVKVSGHLVGMQDELRCVKQPVVVAMKKVGAALEKLSQLEQTVHSQIDDATEVELARLFDVISLKMLLLYNSLCERMEELPSCLHLKKDDQQQQQLRTGHTSSALVDAVTVAAGSAHVRELLRGIAAVVQQMRCLHSTFPRIPQRAKEYEEGSSLLHEATQISHHVFTNVYLALYEDYMRTPREPLRQGLLDVMGFYRTAGEVQEFCQMYRERILRPLLDSVLSWGAATQARHSLQDTINLLASLRDKLETRVLCFLPLLREVFGGAVLPVPMIVWPALCEALVRKMVSLYDISVATTFQKCYLAAHELLHLMGANCASTEELCALMQSPDVALWEHKWNTDVYGAMQTNELSKRVTDAIRSVTTTPFKQLAEQQQRQEHTLDTPAFRIQALAMLKEALDWLFSSDSYIYPVTSKFIREAAGAIRRVSQSVLEHIEAQKSSNSMQDWLSVAVSATVDLDVFAAYIEGPFCARLEETSGQTFAVSSPLIQLLAEDTCRRCFVCLQRSMQDRVTEECLVGLQNVRLVRSAYSHMQKPFPTAASWYVPNIVEPLRHFDAAIRPILPPATHCAMMTELVEDVAKRFRALAKETLVTAKKTEESWEKLRRRKETSAGGGRALIPDGGSAPPASGTSTTLVNARPTQETASDRDKMTLQLYLDAKAFVSEVETMLRGGVKVDSLPAIVALFKTLQRANWILGEDIPEPPVVDESDS